MVEAFKKILLSQNVDIKVIKAIEGLASASDITAFEFEFIFDATYRLFTEEFIYVGGNLTQKNYYTDLSKSTKIWQVDYTYNVGGELIQKDIQFISTGQTLRITYTWVAGDLTQKDRSWV